VTPQAPIATTTSLHASANPVVVPQSVRFNAIVSPTPHGGTVGFTQDGHPIVGCAAVPVSSGQASCAVAYPDAGTFSVWAVYGGHAGYGSSTSNVVAERVNPAPTSTVLTVSRNPTMVGAALSYAVTISPAPNGGTVAFAQDGHPIVGCAAVPVSSGQASCAVAYPDAGTFSVGAVYGGHLGYGSSTSNVVAERVPPAPTSTVLIVSRNPTMVGDALSYAVTISPAPNGGTVAFRQSGRVVIVGCTEVLI
jgi:hypothetical protein